MTQLDQVYIRGQSVRFYVVPDMLAQAPMYANRPILVLITSRAHKRLLTALRTACSPSQPRPPAATLPALTHTLTTLDTTFDDTLLRFPLRSTTPGSSASAPTR